jgi:hypothetical protein
MKYMNVLKNILLSVIPEGGSERYPWQFPLAPKAAKRGVVRYHDEQSVFRGPHHNGTRSYRSLILSHLHVYLRTASC